MVGKDNIQPDIHYRIPKDSGVSGIRHLLNRGLNRERGFPSKKWSGLHIWSILPNCSRRLETYTPV